VFRYIADFTPIRGPVTSTQSSNQKETKQIPPYNGFGSEEDSYNSCLSLLPKPPKRDFARFMEFDRRGLDSNVLRFLARIDTDRAIESERQFIVSYYLSDGTVSVFEPIGKSPGIVNTAEFLLTTNISTIINNNNNTTFIQFDI